ncbi:DUF4150 domain-containing protein [uncultured Roseibium sp.]|uniref:DUF4150 domain-containing protein n=1 Tax=uncultured Roseibium sp. TaxID=1936171 RepID=UPI002610C5CC|nr:DUF4150 domain-containing protein [uncultured Roseibium sp.]
MFCNNQNGTTSLGMPDVCNVTTPAGPVPTPFVNIALSSTAVPNVFNVFLSGGLAHNMLTSTTITSGDEAGVAMGVASGTIIGPSRYLIGSVAVFYGTAPATRLTGTTLQNSTNAPGTTLVPSQFSVMALS